MGRLYLPLLLVGLVNGTDNVVINEFYSNGEEMFVEMLFSPSRVAEKLDGLGMLVLTANTNTNSKREFTIKTAVDFTDVVLPVSESLGVLKFKNSDQSQPEPPNMLQLELRKNWRFYGLLNNWLKVDPNKLLIVILLKSNQNLFATQEFASFFPPLRRLGEHHLKFIFDHFQDALVVRDVNGPVKCPTVDALFGEVSTKEFLTNSESYSLNRCGYGNMKPYAQQIFKHGVPSPGKTDSTLI